MIERLLCPRVVRIGGKIYMLGDYSAQCYDEERDQWTLLKVDVTMPSGFDSVGFGIMRKKWAV